MKQVEKLVQLPPASDIIVTRPNGVTYHLEDIEPVAGGFLSHKWRYEEDALWTGATGSWHWDNVASVTCGEIPHEYDVGQQP